MRAAFLDRDGTIVCEYPADDWRYITEPQFLEGSIEALQEFEKKGFKLIVITNQNLINEGLISQSQYESFTQKMLEVLAENGVSIFKIKYCPHARWEGCSCLKPKTGMIDAVIAEHPEISLQESFMVGDSPCDVGLAEALGMRSFSIGFAEPGTNSTKVNSLRDILHYV